MAYASRRLALGRPTPGPLPEGEGEWDEAGARVGRSRGPFAAREWSAAPAGGAVERQGLCAILFGAELYQRPGPALRKVASRGHRARRAGCRRLRRRVLCRALPLPPDV